MPIISLSTGQKFESGSGSSILEAATKAHIALPYSCKSGRCSACKCRVISGTTEIMHPETGLSEEEKSEGWVLSCVRKAQTDLVLEVDDLGGIELPAVRTVPCRISQITRLAPDVVQVFLRLPPRAEFRFIPGQYVDVIGPAGIRRSYSLANASFADKLLELHIRAVHGGAMSDYWFSQAKVNDLLRLNGPLGTFFVRQTATVDLYFLATGTGIAPVKAILESLGNLGAQNKPKSVTLLWGGRLSGDFYLDVNAIPGQYTYVQVQSRPDEAWTGAKGYVQEVLFDMAPDMGNAAVYACGSNAMIQSAKQRLLGMGLPANRFYSDAFVPSGVN